MHPIVHHLITLRSDSLCDLALMMREDQVHTTAMNVEVVTQIFPSHSRTLAVPTRETVAPRRGPAHDMLRLRTFPQRKINRVTFLLRTIKLTGRLQHVFDVTTGEDAITMVFVVFLHIEID